MDFLTIAAVVCLLLVALVFSPLGLGGGVLYVPILYYMLEWKMQEAVVASLSLVFMVALGSSLAHSGSGYADNKVANTGRLTAIPAAIIGVVLSSILLSSVGDIGIKLFAAMILALVIERTIRRSLTSEEGQEQEIEISQKTNQYRMGTAFAGAASGILGIGGGAILVTLNRSILKMDANKAAGTSYLIGATIVPVALLSHIILNKNVDTILEITGILPAIIIPAMAFSCAYFGAKYAIKYFSKSVITGVFLCAVSLSLLRYIWDFISLI